ncbi:MAG: hypothetical protein KGL48_12730 [Sphingomonadales bacterium]|nr:hypothetical protein [Sphingomonadales bacterium]MDE2569470.1 hypothetical protein [Sphingomonadales bacterium]
MTATETLLAYMDMPDPFRNAPGNLTELQLEAVRERFARQVERVPVLARRAKEMGITEIGSLDDIVPLLFAHTNYKSYPEAFIDNGQWKHMSMWLQTMSSVSTSNIDVEGCKDVDDWIDRAKAAGHWVFSSSGTSGKNSFLNEGHDERERARNAYLHGFNIATPGYKPAQDRHVFSVMAPKGVHKLTYSCNYLYDSWAKPDGGLHRLIEDAMLAMDTMRPHQLRRLLASGKIGPAEMETFEREMAAKSAVNSRRFDNWVDEIISLRHEPLYIACMWAQAWMIVERLRERGVRDGAFHPDTILSLGGGIKGAKVPPDYREQIMCFFGVDEGRLSNSYGMVEISGFNALIQPHGVYATPPWLVPLVLDKTGETLLNPAGGRGLVEGRMAFFDLNAEYRWGGIISGDKVTVEFGSGLDGVKTPIVRSIARYADLEEGEDKLTCAGTIDGYVRGNVAA